MATSGAAVDRERSVVGSGLNVGDSSGHIKTCTERFGKKEKERRKTQKKKMEGI